MLQDIRVHARLDDIDPAQWDALDPSGYPFLRHAFLSALEHTGCVGPGSGWQACHLAAYADGRLCAALPLYRKAHSLGEFVFDFAWADAYDRLGLSYYPKLVNAIPFTPAGGPRALPTTAEAAELHLGLLRAAMRLMDRDGLSSFHCLFPEEAQARRWSRESGMLLRRACQFRWHNAGFAHFDDHLATFSAEKRKKIRRERRRVAETGLSLETWAGREMTPRRWQAIYPLLADTFHRHGHRPYLNQAFFEEVGRTLGDQMHLFVALDGATPVGAALTFSDTQTLYGRYWGVNGQWDCLHFELCYHLGIEHCIAHGLAAYDPGTQGEHKLPRGFLPTLSWSLHWIADPRLRAAIGDFVGQEALWVDRYAAQMASHSPLKSSAP